MPKDSVIVKEGELLKVGKKTSTMRARYYILRDNALFIFNNKDQKFPSNIISLRGLYITPVEPEKGSNYHGFSISHENEMVRSRTFYHRNQEAIIDWIKCLKWEANNLNFDDKYIRGRKLGKGKFSTVYECQNKETQEIVAMKHIHKPSLTEREREFLREEIQIIKLISHPNIVSMRETYETEKYMFIIMDQVKGGELFEHIKNYELEEREISLIVYQIVEAIQYLQTCGVVHRDLKPENILIEKDPHTEEVSQIKITDFGLSKIVAPNEIMMESCGTPAYVAPEVLIKKGYKKQVDIWSAGVIYYTLVCRQLPFQSPDRKITFNLIKERHPDMTHNAFRRVSKATKDIIVRMLAKDPLQRITPEQILTHKLFTKKYNFRKLNDLQYLGYS